MKFERLNVPDWPLPDLVAFNRRVHERIDPLWRRRWVGWITWTFAGLFALVAAMWIYFASGLPSSEKLLAYQPDLPTNIRGYDGTPVKTFARERRVDLAYDEIRRSWFTPSSRPKTRISSSITGSTSAA